MIWNILLFIAHFASALKHAYLEALLHKALDSLFGGDFIGQYIKDNDFNTLTLRSMSEESWCHKVHWYFSAWEIKLDEDRFGDTLKTISMTISTWKDFIGKEQNMLSEDVVWECANICKLICQSDAFATLEMDGRISQVNINQSFLYLVYRIRILSIDNISKAQVSYFELLNSTNELMEITAISPTEKLKTGKRIEVYNYEKVSKLAVLLTNMIENSHSLAIQSTRRSSNYAKGALRFVVSARMNEQQVLAGRSKDMKETMITECKNLCTFTTASLEEWAKGRAKDIIGEILTLSVFPPAVQSIEKVTLLIQTDTDYPLPISIVREIESMESKMRPAELISILTICQKYRVVARMSHKIYRKQRSVMSMDEKSKHRGKLQESILTLCSRVLPPIIVDSFRMHFQSLNFILDYLPSMEHYSKLTFDRLKNTNEDYLHLLTGWINEASKAVPDCKRNEFLQLMMKAVIHEVKNLIPEEQRRQSVYWAMLLMIDGGLRTFYSINQL